MAWWFWPQFAPLMARRLLTRGTGEAIVVLADDPRRTETALELWLQNPSSTLWILGGPSLQTASIRQLQRRGIDPSHPRVEALLDGHDTVGQLTALSLQLPSAVGSVVMVTGQAHRERALSIARLALGCRGIRVQSPPAAALPPESLGEEPLRRSRDQLRVQLWRASGWDGRSLGLWLGMGPS